MPVMAATVVQVLHGLFYALLQLLVVAAIILSIKFYCKFYCSCDPSLTDRKCNSFRFYRATLCVARYLL